MIEILNRGLNGDDHNTVAINVRARKTAHDKKSSSPVICIHRRRSLVASRTTGGQPVHHLVKRESRRLLARRAKRTRRAASLVEFALILPVFGLLMVGILEFGHIYMVYNTMTAAAKRGARYGSVAGITNSDVVARVSDILDSAIDTGNAEILVKDASIFDTPEVDVATIQYDELDDVSIDQLEPRQLFLVYINIPYNDVAILPPFWANNLTLTAQSVMRHE